MSAQATMSKVKPFCNSVTVIESEATDRMHGEIIIPKSRDERYRKGVVIDVGDCLCESWQHLEQGTVIYFQEGTKIGDVTVVYHDHIIAYERAD